MNNDDLMRAINQRHSVRNYLDKPFDRQTVCKLEQLISRLNAESNLNMQLVTEEPRAFRGIFAYGKFHNVRNYIVITGGKSPDLDFRVGYWGELLVLQAQLMGLNTCWVGLSYSKIPNTFTLRQGHKVVCYISVGYGATQGVSHRIKALDKVSNISSSTPEWFRMGVESALLAPTAINQQKFYFEYLGEDKVAARRRFSPVGYTHLDLGIAVRHFEIGANRHIAWE